MTTKCFILALLAAFALCSCGTPQTQPLSAANAAVLKGRTVQLVHGERPPFAIMTPGKVLGMAAAGMVAGAISGNQGLAHSMNAQAIDAASRRNEMELTDPAPYVGARLGQALSQRHGCKVSSYSKLSEATQPKKVAAAGAGSDYSLDVRTLNWGGVYYPMSWFKYRLIYASQMRLIENRSAKVVAQATYIDMGGDASHAPSYKQFTANNNQRVRQEISRNEAASLNWFQKHGLGH
jgi:hypothetical protein